MIEDEETRGSFVRTRFPSARRIVGRIDARSGHSATLPFNEERIRSKKRKSYVCGFNMRQFLPTSSVILYQGVPKNWPAPRSIIFHILFH